MVGLCCILSVLSKSFTPVHSLYKTFNMSLTLFFNFNYQLNWSLQCSSLRNYRDGKLSLENSDSLLQCCAVRHAPFIPPARHPSDSESHFCWVRGHKRHHIFQVPAVLELEAAMHQLLRQRASRLVQRRQDDIKDESSEFASLSSQSILKVFMIYLNGLNSSLSECLCVWLMFLPYIAHIPHYSSLMSTIWVK